MHAVCSCERSSGARGLHAGLTVGFVITAFLILCLLIVVGMNHSFAVTIAERVEALEKTTSKLVEAGALAWKLACVHMF